ncbi:hypothetical protein A3709_19165 [Halioglobus sp. HI00S01]|uniref:XF1762 family protein n=1 Tax=Halioglobus sp. HI00S01 TaxID=1822214 RepID=UPI0007C3DD10|nr:XF1762 family protein [Halioglobus sp. HI00S01]KZX57745.1 hypothetical protein A3709_19165 [Halioglobus sp. HI00S01]
MATCEYCAGEQHLEILEVWGREFMLDTCCEHLHAEAVALMQGRCRDPWIREAFARMGISARSVVDVEGQVVLDHGLSVGSVDFSTACEFIAKHHEHHQPPRGWRWGHAIYNGSDLIGVATVGRPVARMISGETTVEINRLAVRRDMGRLTWNACSKLYAEAAKEAKKRGYERIITYILESEQGATLKAAGWDLERITQGGSWNSPSRPREDKAPTCAKRRYGKTLRQPKNARTGQQDIFFAAAS